MADPSIAELFVPKGAGPPVEAPAPSASGATAPDQPVETSIADLFEAPVSPSMPETKPLPDHLVLSEEPGFLSKTWTMIDETRRAGGRTATAADKWITEFTKPARDVAKGVMGPAYEQAVGLARLVPEILPAADLRDVGEGLQAIGEGNLFEGGSLAAGGAMAMALPGSMGTVQDATKAIATNVRRAETTGQYVGAPVGLDSPQKLTALNRRLEKMALEVVSETPEAKFWYERSSRSILDVMDGDVDKADKFVQMLAALSTLTPVQNNMDFALRAWNQYHTGGVVNVGMFPNKMSKEVQGILDGTADVTGLKRSAFYANLMQEIDPSRVPSGAVTVDRWILEALGFDRFKSGVTATQNEFGQKQLQKIAARLGWKPHQVQAAIWVGQKTATEGKPFSVSTFDFSNSLENTRAQVSWEAIPHEDIGHLPMLSRASPEVKAEYHQAAAAAFLDEGGQDIAAKELGLLSPGDFEAPSAFEGGVQPGAQTLAQIPVTKSAKPGFRVDADSRLLIETYAGLRAALLRQKAVAWHIPVYAKPLKSHNGYDLNIDRLLTSEETQNLYEAIIKRGGGEDWAPIGSPTGTRVLNFEEFSGFTNKQFHDIMNDAVGDVFDEGKVGTFSSEGNFLDSDVIGDPDGQAFRSQATAAGRPDLQKRVDRLYAEIGARLDAVDREFAEDLGDVWRPRVGEQTSPEIEVPIPSPPSRQIPEEAGGG